MTFDFEDRDIDVIASTCTDPEGMGRALGVEPAPLGDGYAAVAENDLDDRSTDWRLALHSREWACLVIRASVFSGLYAEVAAFHEGRRLFAFELSFGELDRDEFEHIFLEAAEADGGSHPPICPALARPWPRAIREGLVDEVDEDPEFMMHVADGLSPADARAQLARSRARWAADDCRAAGTTPDEERLRAVLLGQPDRPVGDDLDDLFTGMGLPGVGAWLEGSRGHVGARRRDRGDAARAARRRAGGPGDRLAAEPVRGAALTRARRPPVIDAHLLHCARTRAC